MAGKDAIAGVIAQALLYCRKHQKHEVEAAIGLWHSIFKDTPASELQAAVVQWAENLDESAFDNQRLPKPKTIQRILSGEGNKATPPDRRPPPVDIASPAIKGQHIRAGRRIGLIAKTTTAMSQARDRMIPNHEHVPPSYDEADGSVIFYGHEDCPACNMPPDPGREQRRAEIQAVLDELPEPGPEAARDCRCDGSGMIDTAASRDAMLSLEWLPRSVFPCPVCNREQFLKHQERQRAKPVAS